MKILMVCLGNICRSPLAEGILTHKVNQEGLDWDIQSAGTGAWHVGNPPDPRSVSEAKINGIDISQQRARKFVPDDYSEFDLIFAMDSNNYNDIVSEARSEADKSKVSLIMNMTQDGMNKSVPDPYWDDNGFSKVFGMLEVACTQIINKYR